MTYRPNQKGKYAQIITFLCIVVAVLLFFASTKVQMYVFVYQITAIVLMVAGIEIFMKYVMSDYVYKASEQDIEIYKVTGNKSVCICSLSYEESVSGVVTRDYCDSHREKFGKSKITVNYCKNIFPKEYSLYFFNFNSKLALLKFEPDEAFTKYMNEKITAAISAKERAESDDE